MSHKQNSGFTLPEMILVVVVMGIFLTMVFPDITRLLQFNAEKTQEANMKDLQLAIEARMKDFDAIRADGFALSAASPTLITALDAYTKLPSERIGLDEWEEELQFRMATVNENYRGIPVTVTYFAALSTGADKARDGGTTFPGTLTAANYANIIAGGDDMVIKFTDYPQQITTIDDSHKKIQAIEQKLEAYAEARLAEYIDIKEKYCDDINDSEITGNERNVVRARYPAPSPVNVDLLECYEGEFGSNNQDDNRIIFYPPDGYETSNARRNIYGRSSGPVDNRQGSTTGTTNLYAVNLIATNAVSVAANSVAQFSPHGASTGLSITYAYNSNRNNRGAGMVRLMRIIGLPDEYCCSLDGEPFYYISRPDADGVCNPANTGTWSRPAIGAAKKPAKVTIEREC